MEMTKSVTLTAEEAFEHLKKHGKEMSATDHKECLQAILFSDDLRFAIWACERFTWLDEHELAALGRKIERSTSLQVTRSEHSFRDKDGNAQGESMLSVSDGPTSRVVMGSSGSMPPGLAPITIRSHIAKGPDGKHAYVCMAMVHPNR